MAEVATTRLSSRGQVVIPESVRKRMKLKPGDRFVVVGRGDVVILKAISAPEPGSFDELLKEARRKARQAGLKRSDVARAVSEARAARR